MTKQERMMEKELTENQKAGAIIIDVAYHFVMAASLLMYRFEPIFLSSLTAEKGKTRMMLNRAADNISGAIKILNTFDDAFLKASEENGRLWDFYQSVSYELIAFCLAFLGHVYKSPEDSNEVLQLMLGKGEQNESLDKVVDYYLHKALECSRTSKEEAK